MDLKTYISSELGRAAALAADLGVSPSYLSQMANGLSPISGTFLGVNPGPTMTERLQLLMRKKAADRTDDGSRALNLTARIRSTFSSWSCIMSRRASCWPAMALDPPCEEETDYR